MWLNFEEGIKIYAGAILSIVCSYGSWDSAKWKIRGEKAGYFLT